MRMPRCRASLGSMLPLAVDRALLGVALASGVALALAIHATPVSAQDPPPPVERRGPAPGTQFVYRFIGSWPDEDKDAVVEADNRWAAGNTTGVTYREAVGNEPASVIYRWDSTLPANVGAQTNFDEQTSFDAYGHITGYVTSFNPAIWDDDALLKVALHEGGHGLGLGDAHGTDGSSVMNQMGGDLGDSLGYEAYYPTDNDVSAADDATNYSCDVGPDNDWNCPDGYWLGDDDCCHDTDPPPMDVMVVDATGAGQSVPPVFGPPNVRFSGRGASRPVWTSWPEQPARYGFLVIDKNHNGRVDGGDELLSNFTEGNGRRCSWGAAKALRALDSPALGGNGDGVLDSRDREFADLEVWFNRGHDGATGRAELVTLAQLKIVQIPLAFNPLGQSRDASGSLVVSRLRGVKIGGAPVFVYNAQLRRSR